MPLFGTVKCEDAFFYNLPSPIYLRDADLYELLLLME